MKNLLGEHFMQVAITQARKGIRNGENPFGACISKNGKIISRTHDFANSKKDVAAHAETEAVKLACDNLKTTDLSGCVLYATCEPCPLCFTVIHLARIKKVVFGMSVKYGRKLGYLKDSVPSIHIKKLLSSPVKITGNVLKEDSIALIRLWERINKKN